MTVLSPRERAIRQRLKDDFAHYALKCLKIRAKSGAVVPFALNRVQRLVHERAEAQLAATGRVRAIVLKARQPGISTYIEGRFYWKVTHRRGVRAFILTHRDQATANLLAIARRFHDNAPAPVRPETRAANASELDFGRLDSGYRVGTAKAEGIGRSDTVQYFHGSEVAFWTRAEEHVAGVLQAVPDRPGTEIWLESTANGIGGAFHNLWRAAERGEGGYMPIFIGWFLHDDYRAECPATWRPPEAFAAYGAAHGLDRAQLYWAWTKNAELALAESLPTDDLCWRFRQEYPATAEEAFQASGDESFIPSVLVLAARKFEAPPQVHAALVIGCDFARGQRDRNWFISRQGRVLGAAVDERFHSDDTVDIAGKLSRLIDKHDPDMCFLDPGGGGAAVYDILAARGYRRRLTLVNFGGRPQDERTYANKRAEMWGELRRWLADPGGAELPDDDVLHAELTAPGWTTNFNGQIVLEDKDRIRARLGFSPDGGDAAALTFAEPVRRPEDSEGAPTHAIMHETDTFSG